MDFVKETEILENTSLKLFSCPLNNYLYQHKTVDGKWERKTPEEVYQDCLREFRSIQLGTLFFNYNLVSKENIQDTVICWTIGEITYETNLLRLILSLTRARCQLLSRLFGNKPFNYSDNDFKLEINDKIFNFNDIVIVNDVNSQELELFYNELIEAYESLDKVCKLSYNYNGLPYLEIGTFSMRFGHNFDDALTLSIIRAFNKYLSGKSLISSVFINQEPGESGLIIYNNKVYSFYEYNERKVYEEYPEMFKDGLLGFDDNSLKHMDVFEDFIEKYTKELNCEVKQVAKDIYTSFNREKFVWAVHELSDNDYGISKSREFLNELDKLETLFNK